MTDKPVYRWTQRRAARDRREKLTKAISSHDLVMLAVIMAMLVLVVRIVLLYGITQGMELGPFRTDVEAMEYEPSPYVNMKAVNESFRYLTTISGALFLYWILVSWRYFTLSSVSLSTKFFKALIGITILILLAVSLFPDNALYLVRLPVGTDFQPQDRLVPMEPG